MSKQVTLKMNSFLKIFVLYCFISLSETVNEDCDIDSTCVLATYCSVALREIKINGHHNFKRCGFEGITEIVCCPNAENKFGSQNSTTSSPRITLPVQPASKLRRVADIECEKIVNTTAPPLSQHILGGEEASLGEFPHMVAIGYNVENVLEFKCGGSLLSTRYVVTAAHCIEHIDQIEPEMVRVGVIVLGDKKWHDETDFRIAEIKTHPEYTPREKYNDIALIRLSKPVETTNNAHPICLYTGKEDPDMSLTITGWGVTNTKLYNSKSNILMKANVTLFSRTECGESYTNLRALPRGVISQQLCAGDRQGISDTCQGDSGGPLQAFTGVDGQYRLIGITSFGRACGVYPGVYTRISQYLDWIENIVWS